MFKRIPPPPELAEAVISAFMATRDQMAAWARQPGSIASWTMYSFPVGTDYWQAYYDRGTAQFYRLTRETSWADTYEIELLPVTKVAFRVTQPKQLGLLIPGFSYPEIDSLRLRYLRPRQNGPEDFVLSLSSTSLEEFKIRVSNAGGQEALDSLVVLEDVPSPLN
jgi:hypothetical protein